MLAQGGSSMWEDPETHVSNGVTTITFVLCQSNQWVAEQWEANALSTVLLIGHPICLHPYLQILWGQQRLAPSSGAGHISEISRNHTEIWQLLGWCLTNQCTFSSLRKKKNVKEYFWMCHQFTCFKIKRIRQASIDYIL